MGDSYEDKMKEILLAQENLKTQSYVQGLSQGGQYAVENPSVVKEQLSLGEELETLDYLLRSYTLEFNTQTKRNEWTEAKNEDEIILSDYGIHLFRQLISAYINKNTLLSNYDADTILTKMYDIANVINDDIFLSYEKIFAMPTIARCKKELDKEIDEKLQIREIAYDLTNIKFDKIEEKKEVIKELEYELEKKILKIRSKLFQAKLKRFNLLLRFIQDTIHSAYNRAFMGQERRSLRQHMTITETNGGFNMPREEKKSLLSKMGITK